MDPRDPSGAFSRFETSEQVAHSARDDAAPQEAAGEESFSVRASRTYEPIDRPVRRPFPVMWALLALPVFLLAGWLVGQMPARTQPAPGAPVPGAVPVVVDPQASSPAPVAADPEPERTGRLSSWTTLARAEEESKRTGKPIMLDFNAAWCGPCRMMKSQVFDDAQLGDAVRRAVIPVSVVDRSREDGRNSDEVETLLQNWSIEAFPTLVVYKPGTGRSMQSRGFGGARATVDWIEQSASVVR